MPAGPGACARSAPNTKRRPATYPHTYIGGRLQNTCIRNDLPKRAAALARGAGPGHGPPPLTFPEEVTSATHIRNGLSVALGAAWNESMASRRVGPSYQDDSGPPSVLLDTFSADSPDAGKNRTWWCWVLVLVGRGGRGSSDHRCQGVPRSSILRRSRRHWGFARRDSMVYTGLRVFWRCCWGYERLRASGGLEGYCGPGASKRLSCRRPYRRSHARGAKKHAKTGNQTCLSKPPIHVVPCHPT